MLITKISRCVALQGLVCTLLFLAACGGGSGAGSTDNDDNTGGGGGGNEKPTAVVVFPPLNAIHTGHTAVIRGIANDDSGIASVTVNGVDAISNDDFANWTASIPLEPGTNSIRVTVVDDEGEMADDADALEIIRTPLPIDTPTDIDYVNGTAYVLDSASRALFKVTSEGRTVLSSAAIGDGEPFGGPISVVVTSDEKTAYVADNRTRALVKVDLETGDRTTIASPDDGRGSAIGSPFSVAYDDVTGFVYLLEPGFDNAWTIHTIKSDLTRTATDEYYSTGTLIPFARDMEWHAGLGRLIVMSDEGGVFSLDPSNGDPTQLTTETDVAVTGPLDDVALDDAGTTAYLLDKDGIIYSMDVQTPAGVTKVFDGSAVFESADTLEVTSGASLVVADADTGVVYAIDHASDTTEVLEDSGDAHIGEGERFSGWVGAVDLKSGKAWAYNGEGKPLGIFDLETGSRTLGEVAVGYAIRRMIPDPANQRVLAMDDAHLLGIDPTGAVTQLGTLQSPGFASAMALDPAGNRVFYTQSNVSEISVISLDTFLAETWSTAPGIPNLTGALSVDRQHNRLLFTSYYTRQIHTIDLSTEAITFLEPNTLSVVTAMDVNASGTDVYVLDIATSNLVRINLDNESSEVVAGVGAGSSTSFGTAYSLAVDESAGIAWTVASGSLIALDIETGDHVIVSR